MTKPLRNQPGHLVRGISRRFVTASIAAILLLLLTGCTHGSLGLKSPTLKVGESEPQGKLLLSIGAEYAGKGPTPLLVHSLHFREIGTEPFGEARLHMKSYSLKDKHDIDIANGQLFLNTLAIPLRPGRYEIFWLRMETDVGTYAEWITNEHAFSIPFEIRENEATYVGSYVSKTLIGKNLFGMKVREGSFIVLSDQQERDLALLRGKGLIGEATVVHKQIGDFAETAEGLIVRGDR